VVAEVVVEHLEDGERVPRVGRLLFQDDVQIDPEQCPERFTVVDHRVREPLERLDGVQSS